MGKHKRAKAVPVRKLTALDILAQQTDTQPHEWRHVTRGTIMHRKGYRYYHPARDLYAAYPKEAQT